MVKRKRHMKITIADDGNVKWLWHGTRQTDPSVIYTSNDEGFDSTFGNVIYFYRYSYILLLFF
jgi:hypothetical protein